MNPLALITRGFQGEKIIKRYYELPIIIKIDYGDIEIENLIEQEINLTVEVD